HAPSAAPALTPAAWHSPAAPAHRRTRLHTPPAGQLQRPATGHERTSSSSCLRFTPTDRSPPIMTRQQRRIIPSHPGPERPPPCTTASARDNQDLRIIRVTPTSG